MFSRPSVLPLYPLFLAAYFPLYLMVEDLGMTELHSVVRPTLVCALAALLIMAVLGAVLRDIYRAALLTALLIVLICYFRLIDMIFHQQTRDWIGEMPGIYTMAVLLVLCAVIGILSRPGPNATRIANVATAVMIAFPIATLVWREVIADDAAARAISDKQRETLFGTAQPTGTPPNIVHIVLDAYTRQDVLADLYGFDNAPFIDRLRRMKFAVADRATTPYNQTMLVMTSMFSASYLDASVPPGSRTSLRRVLRTELHHNPVMETLSRLGYRTAALDVRYDPVRMGQVDRLLGSYRVSNFEMKIFEQTVLHSIARRLGLLGPSVTRDFFDTPYERDLTGPLFLYVHALAPHPPFDIDRHGNEIEPVGGWRGLSDGSHFTQYDPDRRRMYRDGYVEKLRFTNDRILSYLSRIMNDIPDPKIIILHGDHGGGILYDQDSADNTCGIERFSPLLAVYSSDGRLQPALAPDTNLVNLYRLVFNTYFNSDLPLLPNRSTYADWLEPTKQQTLAPDQLSRTCHQTDIVSELHQTPAVPFRDD